MTTKTVLLSAPRLAVLVLAAMASAVAAPRSVADNVPVEPERYQVQPGDLLAISVWKEDTLQGDVLVRPDGGLSFPLAGDIQASGRSIEELDKIIAERLERFIPKPVVTVALKQIGGNRVYVLGKVTHPGEYPFMKPVDVMQALSLAGGTTEFAALNDIVILRRENETVQAIRFRYGDVERGKDLAQDVVLRSGDTVVVP
jgi:polysaccharide biosynthesis/export protein